MPGKRKEHSLHTCWFPCSSQLESCLPKQDTKHKKSEKPLQRLQTLKSLNLYKFQNSLWKTNTVAKGRTTLTGRFLDFTPWVAAIAVEIVENGLAGISARLNTTRLSRALSKCCSSCTRHGAHRPILIQRISILQQHRNCRRSQQIQQIPANLEHLKWWMLFR